MSVVRDIEFTQIAADWDSITLGEEEPQALLAMRNGLATKQVQDNGEYKVSRIETIRDGWIDDTHVRFVSGLEEKDVEKYLLQKGDILFSHINSDRHLGKTGFADRDYDDLLHGMNLLLIRANPEVFAPEFLNRVFQYYRDIGVFIAICSRAVNQSSINQAKMKALELPLPPLPEQKKIARVLSTAQRAIEAQERIIQTTTELKKALMHKLFTEGLRNEPQKQTEIGPVPESWEVVEVGQICRSIVPGRNKPKIFDGDIPWLTTPDIKRLDYIESDVAGLRVSPAELKSSGGHLIPANSVIMSCVGEFGVSAVTRVEIVINQQLHAFVCSADLEPVFLCNQLRYRKPYMESIAAVTTIPYLNKSKCESIPIALPNREEQNDIAAIFMTLDSKRNEHESHRQTLQDLFRTLLHELMTAKVRVHSKEFSFNFTTLESEIS